MNYLCKNCCIQNKELSGDTEVLEIIFTVVTLQCLYSFLYFGLGKQFFDMLLILYSFANLQSYLRAQIYPTSQHQCKFSASSMTDSSPPHAGYMAHWYSCISVGNLDRIPRAIREVLGTVTIPKGNSSGYEMQPELLHSKQFRSSS